MPQKLSSIEDYAAHIYCGERLHSPQDVTIQEAKQAIDDLEGVERELYMYHTINILESIGFKVDTDNNVVTYTGELPSIFSLRELKERTIN